MLALIKKFSEAKKANQNSITCWGTGSALREFMHVDDLADAVIFALEKWDPKSKDAPKDSNNNPYSFLNVGSGDEISIKNLTEKIAAITDYRGIIEWDNSKPDGTPRKFLDSSNIKKLGWRPKITLDEGLKKTIRDYLKEKF